MSNRSLAQHRAEHAKVLMEYTLVHSRSKIDLFPPCVALSFWRIVPDSVDVFDIYSKNRYSHAIPCALVDLVDGSFEPAEAVRIV